MAVQAFLWFFTTYQWNINSDFYNRSHVDINRRDSVTGLNVFFPPFVGEMECGSTEIVV